MRINREQFNKWIKALKSGRYKQTKITLQDESGYCCLGLGCKILIPKKELKLKDSINMYGNYPDDQPKAPKWLQEINDDFKTNERNITSRSLSKLNDQNDWTFEQISEALTYVYPERKKKHVSNKRILK